jgi:hypothetical protein
MLSPESSFDQISLAVPYSQGTLPHLTRIFNLSDLAGGSLLSGDPATSAGTSIKQRPVPQVDPSQLAQIWPPSLSSTTSMEEVCFRL